MPANGETNCHSAIFAWLKRSVRRLAGPTGVGLMLLGAGCAQSAARVTPVAVATATPLQATAPASPTVLPSATATVAPSATTTATDTATPLPTASATASATALPTATSTRTATARPRPTLAPTVVPPTDTAQPPAGPPPAGRYLQTVPCAPSYTLLTVTKVAFPPTPFVSETQVTWCIDSVLVKPGTGNMEFNVYWVGQQKTDTKPGHLESQTYNHGMYLIDDHGQRYDHIGTNGAAALGGLFDTHLNILRLDGVFIFPPDHDGARTFTFYDDGYHVALTGITLNETPQPP